MSDGTARCVSPPKPGTRRAGWVPLAIAANFRLWALWVLKAIWGSSHLLRDTGEVAFPISVASSPRLPADTSVPSSFQSEISIFPEKAPVTFWPELTPAPAPGEVAGGLWAPYNSEGLAAWAFGSCGLIHQLGGFDSDKGLISSDRRGGRRFMAPLPPGLEWEISSSRGDLAQPGGGLC